MNSLAERLQALGARAPHVRAILRAWLAGRGIEEPRGPRAAAFPVTLREALPGLRAWIDGIAPPLSEHRAADGSIRFLHRLRDGATVESVLLPREGLCVSTQAGCAVGCLFCMTGRGGLERNLAPDEILAQVALARRRRAVRRVVFMGMGEPGHNIGPVLEGIARLGNEGGTAHKNLVFSTVGDPRWIERLAGAPARPALALSLHTTDAVLRARLLPRAPRVDPRDLVRAADDYARRTTYPIQYQWTLLEGVNDGEEDVLRLASWVTPRRAIINFIPWNPVEGADFRRPSLERMRALARMLHRRGILAKLRRSAAQDVEGACGQLRARRS